MLEFLSSYFRAEMTPHYFAGWRENFEPKVSKRRALLPCGQPRSVLRKNASGILSMKILTNSAADL